MSLTYNIDELDVIFLTYNEPRCEEFWVEIVNHIPWAKRMHGVTGSDAAHKAAAQCSDTERFIIIDGDNKPCYDFFESVLTLPNPNAQLRWRAYNVINGLTYGNGGISCWTKDYVSNMRTHEASVESDTSAIDFCYDEHYYAMNDVVSTTYPNQSAQQAYRAGFREGVKLLLSNGKTPNLFAYKSQVWPDNLKRLMTWYSIGRDVDYGDYAMLGARMGSTFVLQNDWDIKNVRDFDYLDDVYLKHIHNNDVNELLDRYKKQLDILLGINIPEYSSLQSEFIKKNFMSYTNLGVSVLENLGTYFNELS